MDTINFDETKQLNISIPYPSSSTISTIKSKLNSFLKMTFTSISSIFFDIASASQKTGISVSRSGRSFAKNPFKNPKFKNTILIAIPAIAVVVLVVGVIKVVTANTASNQSVAGAATSLAKPLKTADVNREFSFSLKDSTGKIAGEFKYKILTAELDKQIIVKGTRATAIDGRVFLILNLQLTNSENQGLSVNTKDYVRLALNGKPDLYAPEIHNDPVDVQAISTKFTRLGFTVNETDKDFILKVGEITGKKQDISLKFK